MEFVYRECGERDAAEHVRNGEADIAFISAPADDDGLRVFKLKSYPVRALVSVKDPLAVKKQIPLKELKERNFIVFSPQWNIYHSFMKDCRASGISPRVAYQVSDALLMHFLCRENEGVGICPAFYCNFLPREGVKALPVCGLSDWYISIVVGKSRKITPLLHSYIETFRSLSSEI